MKNNDIDVVIGTLAYEAGSYILDTFFANQKQIQEYYPAAELVMATSEKHYAANLMNMLTNYSVRGSVICYDFERPDYSKNRIWNITSGREAIRKYFLQKSYPQYLLFLDSDMTFGNSVISTMLKAMQGYDVVFSGYPFKDEGSGLAGCGCVLLTREVLEKVKFRCYEFKNGEVIFEDNLLEMDAYQQGFKINRGFFIGIKHYLSADKFRYGRPHDVKMLRKLLHDSRIRYFLIRLSVAIKFNVPWFLRRCRIKLHL